jgi:hypothetical protein
LREFSLFLPDREAVGQVVDRVRAGGFKVETDGNEPVVVDPFENRIRLSG